MRVLFVLCAALALFVAAHAQPILPTQRMALGMSHDPDTGCVFIIFVDRVKVHCHPADGAVAREIVSPEFLGPRSIVRYTGKTDTNGFLFLLAQDTSISSNQTQLFLVSRTVEPKWVNSTTVWIGSSGSSALKRSDFHLAASRNQLFFMGQVSGQSYGLYSFNSTSSGSAPVLAAALDVPSTSMIREPMFAEFPSSNGIFFRGFPVGSSQPSIFMYDFTARSASPISFQTPQIGATPVDIYGPLQVLRVALGPATVGWIAHETNGTHQLLTDCLYNASAAPPSFCRTTLVQVTRPTFRSAASSGNFMYLFSNTNYFYFPRVSTITQVRSASGSVFDVVHDGDITNSVLLVSQASGELNIGQASNAGFISTPVPGLTSQAAVANNTFFYAFSDPRTTDLAQIQTLIPSQFNPLGSDNLLTCSDSRATDKTFGVAAVYLPAPADLTAVVSVFESGTFLKYYANRDLTTVSATVALFSRAIPQGTSPQPFDVRLAAKLSENSLLLSADFATYGYSGLMRVTRQDSSSPFSATLVSRQGDTQCISQFNVFAFASSVAPNGGYVIFTDFILPPDTRLDAYYLDLTNDSAVAMPLVELGTGNPLYWTPDDRVDTASLPVVHLEDEKYCLIATSTTRKIFCFQRSDPINIVDFAQPIGGDIDYASGMVSSSSAYRILNYVCPSGGGSGVCTYRPFGTTTTSSSMVSNGLIAVMETSNSVVAYPVQSGSYEIQEFVNGSVVASSNYVQTTSDFYRGAAPVPPTSVYGKFILLGENGTSYYLDRCFSAGECYRQPTCPDCSNVAGGRFDLCGVANKGAAFVQTVSGTEVEIVYASVTGKLVSLLRMVEADFRGCRVVSSDPAVVIIISSTSIQAILADRVVEVSAVNSSVRYELQQDPFIKSFELISGTNGKQILASLARTEATQGPLQQNENVVALPFTFCASNSECPTGQNCSFGLCSTLPPPQVAACAPPAPPNSVCINGVWFVPRNVSNNGTVATIPGATVITGSLGLSGNGTLIFTDGAQLNVSGCASFSGNLQLLLNAPQTSGDQVVEVINFAGFCSGAGTQFDTTQITVSGAEPCATSSIKSVQYTSTSLSIVFTFDTSRCFVAPDGTVIPITPATAAGTPANPGGNLGGNDLGGLGIGGIVGIVVAVVAIAVVIMLLSIFWGRFRRAIRPYDEARQTKEEARRRETKEEADETADA